MDGLDLVIFGIPLVALTAGGVEALKGLGLPSKWAPVASVGVGSGLAALNTIRVGSEISPATAAEWALLGVVYGLAASGLYDHAERIFASPAKETAGAIIDSPGGNCCPPCGMPEGDRYCAPCPETPHAHDRAGAALAHAHPMPCDGC